MIKCHLGISSNTYSAYKPLTCKTMHEHDEILPKYMLKCHLGPTQTQTIKIGHGPNKKIKKFCRKNKFS